MIERIGVEAAPQLQHLLERCADFWELIYGTAPAPDSGLQELTSIAPGKTMEDTFTFGVYEDERLIAFAQLARDYPKPSEWWIGLLLVDPDERGRGFGAQIHRQIVEWIEAQAGTAMGLVVQTQNERARRFWLRLGYIEQERQPTIVLMSRPLRTTRSFPSP